jgi:hypothetical protein
MNLQALAATSLSACKFERTSFWILLRFLRGG